MTFTYNPVPIIIRKTTRNKGLGSYNTLIKPDNIVRQNLFTLESRYFLSSSEKHDSTRISQIHLQHSYSQFYPIVRTPSQQDSSETPMKIIPISPEGTKTSRKIMFKFGLFLLAHAIPVGSALYAFKLFTSIQQADDEYVSGETLDEVIQDILKVIRLHKGCFCLFSYSGSPNAYHIEPHFPEEKVLRLPTEQLIPGIKNNFITDAITGKLSEFSLPLNFVHFALNVNSPAYQGLLSDRRISLLYHDPEREISIIMSGLAANIVSKEIKRHYWKSEWGKQFESYESPEFMLIKFVPQNITINRQNFSCKSIQRVMEDQTINWTLVEC